MQTHVIKHPWTPCQTRARRALTAHGHTYRSVAKVMRERGILGSDKNVRNVIAGITKRADIRMLIAELTGKPVQALWPDESRDTLVA